MGVTVAVARMDYDAPRETDADVTAFGSFLRENIFSMEAWTLIDEGGLLVEASRETIDAQLESFAGSDEGTPESAELIGGWLDSVFGEDDDTCLLLCN